MPKGVYARPAKPPPPPGPPKPLRNRWHWAPKRGLNPFPPDLPGHEYLCIQRGRQGGGRGMPGYPWEHMRQRGDWFLVPNAISVATIQAQTKTGRVFAQMRTARGVVVWRRA